MTFVGVDGCRAGWVAVIYDESGYRSTVRYENITNLWRDQQHATNILIDIPIGLREFSNKARPCDRAARDKLRPKRNRSVFATPIRKVARKAYREEIEYNEAKRIQEANTDGSLSPFTWGIVRKIGEVDYFLNEEYPAAQEIIVESHPEVCFWAFNGGGNSDSMSYSKSSQPAAAFWERIDVLETSNLEPEIIEHVRSAGSDLAHKISNDDVLDAFALALTASQRTEPIEELPETRPEEDEGDPLGLPMKIHYARPIDNI